MMNEVQEKQEVSTLRKLTLPVIGGVVVGSLSVFGLNQMFDSEWAGGLTHSAQIAAMVGTFYVIMALGVGGGALSPGVGSKFLNVEDAEDLQEQRAMLLYSAIAMALWGIALVALALAGTGGVLSNQSALWLASATFITGVAVSIISYRHCDELMTAVNLEATAIAYGLVMLCMGGWAMLAHLGFARVPNPLDWITSFYALILVGSFTAAGRRGMLQVK